MQKNAQDVHKCKHQRAKRTLKRNGVTSQVVRDFQLGTFSQAKIKGNKESDVIIT